MRLRFCFLFIAFVFLLTNFCFADFTSIDSIHLSSIDTRVSTISSQLSSSNTYLSSIDSKMTTNNTNLSSILTSTTNCYNMLNSMLVELDSIQGDTTYLRADISSLLTTCQSIFRTVGDINSSLISTQNAITSSASQTQNVISSSASQTQNVITNSVVDDSSIVIDTSEFVADDSEGVFDFFTTFLSNLRNVFSSSGSSVSVINIPLGFVDGSIELRSDIISSVVSGTYLYTLIELFWYFVFGTYYIILTKRILDWVSTGKIADKGISGFIDYLDSQNQVIKTYMM